MLQALRLIRYDYRLLLRDPMLLLLTTLLPVLALALRYGLPAITRAAGEHAALAVVIGVIVLVMQSPLLFGLVTGLMLLEERDDGVLAAIDLTPLGRTSFVALRMLLPVLYSALAAAFVLLLFGYAGHAWPMIAAVAVLAGMQAPLFALFLGAFASNRIEGMALSKVGNVVVALGVLAVLAPWPWQALGWVSPHYWLTRVLLAGATGLAELRDFAAAVVVHALAVAGLARVYARRSP